MDIQKYEHRSKMAFVIVVVMAVVLLVVMTMATAVGAYYVTSEPWAETYFGWVVGAACASIVFGGVSMCLLEHYEHETNRLHMQQF